MMNGSDSKKTLKLNKLTLKALTAKQLTPVVGGGNSFCLGCQNGGTGLRK